MLHLSSSFYVMPVNLLSLIPALFRTAPCCCCFPCLTPSMSAHGKVECFPVLEAFSGAYGRAGECPNESHGAKSEFLWLMWWKKMNWCLYLLGPLISSASSAFQLCTFSFLAIFQGNSCSDSIMLCWVSRHPGKSIIVHFCPLKMTLQAGGDEIHPAYWQPEDFLCASGGNLGQGLLQTQMHKMK